VEGSRNCNRSTLNPIRLLAAGWDGMCFSAIRDLRVAALERESHSRQRSLPTNSFYSVLGRVLSRDGNLWNRCR
jgi:hypothetical protein